MAYYAANPDFWCSDRIYETADPPMALELFNRCGTTACIAGHTLCCMNEEDIQDGDIHDVACAGLGLDDEEANFLFYGSWAEESLDNITRIEAVAYLDECIKEKRIIFWRESRAGARTLPTFLPKHRVS
jgi:hypothetical protein